MDIDPKDVDEITDPKERADFITWLKNLLNYALNRFDMRDTGPEEEPKAKTPDDAARALPEDPIGDVIIEGFKMQQRATRRRSSSWMLGSSGQSASKVDDRHV
jgi:hypothetical protein